MQKTDNFYLADIRKAITTIEKYVKDVDFATFVSDEMRHDATLRQLEIVGEAANKLSTAFRENHPKFPVRQAIAMRNFLIHGYDEIDLEVVWKTIQLDIAQLKLEIDKILG